MKMQIIHIAASRLALAITATLAVPMLSMAGESTAPQAQTINAADGDVALAQTWKIAGDAQVEIENVRGNVVVTVADGDQARLSGNLGHGSRLVIAGDASHLQLHVEAIDSGHGWFGNHGPSSDSDLTLALPRSVALKIEVVSADSKVVKVGGKSIQVSSVSGKVDINSDAAQVDAENVSGDIGFITSNTDASARTHLETVSGSIDAKGGSGRLKLETVSGDIRLHAMAVQEIEAGTVSGTMNIDAVPAKNGRVHVETMSGDVHLQLPATLSARVEAETFSGDLRSDFGKVEKPEHGPGSSLDARVGDGDAQINAQSFSGNVAITRKP